MPTLFRRENGVYYIVYSIDGKRKWKSTLSTEKHLAIKALMNFNKLLSNSSRRILLSRFIEDFHASATSNYSRGTIGIYKQSSTMSSALQSAVGKASAHLDWQTPIEKKILTYH